MPRISSLNLTPNPAFDSSDLNISFILTDNDPGQVLSVNISWYENEINIYNQTSVICANGSSCSGTLDNKNTTRFRTINATVTFFDSDDNNLTSATRLISNICIQYYR